MSIIWDTNAAIYYLASLYDTATVQKLKEQAEAGLIFSQITKLELLGFIFLSAEAERKAHDLINRATIIGIEPAVEEAVIKIRKAKKIKLPDAIIAATALVYDLTLITANTSDFKSILGLKLANPLE